MEHPRPPEIYAAKFARLGATAPAMSPKQAAWTPRADIGVIVAISGFATRNVRCEDVTDGREDRSPLFGQDSFRQKGRAHAGFQQRAFCGALKDWELEKFRACLTYLSLFLSLSLFLNH